MHQWDLWPKLLLFSKKNQSKTWTKSDCLVASMLMFTCTLIILKYTYLEWGCDHMLLRICVSLPSPKYLVLQCSCMDNSNNALSSTLFFMDKLFVQIYLNLSFLMKPLIHFGGHKEVHILLLPQKTYEQMWFCLHPHPPFQNFSFKFIDYITREKRMDNKLHKQQDIHLLESFMKDETY